MASLRHWRFHLTIQVSTLFEIGRLGNWGHNLKWSWVGDADRQLSPWSYSRAPCSATVPPLSIVSSVIYSYAWPVAFWTLAQNPRHRLSWSLPPTSLNWNGSCPAFLPYLLLTISFSLLTIPSHAILFVTQIHQVHFGFRVFAFTLFPWPRIFFPQIFTQVTSNYSGIRLNITSSEKSSMIPPHTSLLVLCSISLSYFLHFFKEFPGYPCYYFVFPHVTTKNPVAIIEPDTFRSGCILLNEVS